MNLIAQLEGRTRLIAAATLASVALLATLAGVDLPAGVVHPL